MKFVFNKKMLFIFFWAFLLFVDIFSYAFVDSNLIYFRKLYIGFAFDYRLITILVYILSILIFFVFYFLILRKVQERVLSEKDIFLLIAISLCVLIFSYPAMLSYDIFNYIATAKVLFFYHENPYLVMPIAFTGDSMLLFTRAANKVALYGPSWIALTGVPFLFGFNNFTLQLFNFKFFTGFFYIGTLFIIKKLKINLLSFTMYALNPLVLIEVLVSSHNDIVMMFFVLMSFYLLKKQKLLFAIICMVLSILVKYATLFLLPVFCLSFWQIYQQRSINWQKIYKFSFYSMLVIFLLSYFRVEIYPWYAVWFLTFLPMVHDNTIRNVSIAFSLGLLLSYIPYLFFLNYFGITPLIRNILTFIFPLLAVMYMVIKKAYGQKIYTVSN